MMERRSFLKGLTGLLSAPLVLDPDKLLWIPGARTIFIPPANKGVRHLTPYQLDCLIEFMGHINYHSDSDPISIGKRRFAFGVDAVASIPDDAFDLVIDQAVRDHEEKAIYKLNRDVFDVKSGMRVDAMVTDVRGKVHRSTYSGGHSILHDD